MPSSFSISDSSNRLNKYDSKSSAYTLHQFMNMTGTSHVFSVYEHTLSLDISIKIICLYTCTCMS